MARPRTGRHIEEYVGYIYKAKLEIIYAIDATFTTGTTLVVDEP
jgi:hypothetical protein